MLPLGLYSRKIIVATCSSRRFAFRETGSAKTRHASRRVPLYTTFICGDENFNETPFPPPPLLLEHLLAQTYTKDVLQLGFQLFALSLRSELVVEGRKKGFGTTDARRIRKRAAKGEEREEEESGYRKSARVRNRLRNGRSLGLNLATVSRSPVGRIAGFHSPPRFTFKIEHHLARFRQPGNASRSPRESRMSSFRLLFISPFSPPIRLIRVIRDIRVEGTTRCMELNSRRKRERIIIKIDSRRNRDRFVNIFV